MNFDDYPHCADALTYAEQVVSGKISACQWVTKACRRQLDDLKRKDLVFRPEKAERICNFIELLPHVKGRWDSPTIRLEAWQKFILTTVFGWYRANGLRRFSTAYIEVPRKNAKSTLSAGIGLYMLMLDGEEGAEVYSAATTRDQAKIVFQIAKQMARKERRLQESYRLAVNAHNLNVLATVSKFEPLSSEADSLEGLNVHCAVIDELHAHKTRHVFDVLETATGSRRQPLLWSITTAGSNRAGICYEQRGYVAKLLDGVTEDDTYFGVIYTVDEEDDWTAEATWRKANPNYGISVFPHDIARLCRKAQELPSAQNSFLTKRLNMWVNADTAWMQMHDWAACAMPELDLDDFEGEPCFVALDLASKIDVAALMLLFPRDDGFFCFGKFYLPEGAIESSNNSQYAGWASSGRLITTPGNVLDFERIEDDLKDIKSRFQIIQVGFDPWQAAQFSTRMMAEGFPMVEVAPNVRNFSGPMKELEALVISRKIHHDGGPVLTWMVSNVVCHRDAKDNIYPRKEHPDNKIDGVVGLIVALNRAMAHRGKQPSALEEHGIRFIEL